MRALPRDIGIIHFTGIGGITKIGAGAVTLTVSCTPQLQPIQASDVLLIFGSQTVAPTSVSTPADPTKPTTVTVDGGLSQSSVGL